VREIEGPIYVHCHHGRHRGPAAAAVACVADGDADAELALEILKRAGTSTHYARLWKDVAAFVPPELDVSLPPLKEVSPPDSLVKCMAQTDRAYHHLTLCQEAGWTMPSDHPDIVPRQAALLLKEALRETLRNQTQNQENCFMQWMGEAETLAEKLEEELRAGRLHKATSVFHDLGQSCARCHRAYRD
jgi:hypothetical protein